MESEFTGPRVSLREIARRLDVSHVTVSLAIRNSPSVSDTTRAKIQKLAGELGYRPDPILCALADYRNGGSKYGIHSVVAWINAWEDPEALRAHKEFDLYWKGASQCAAKHGHVLEEFRVGKRMDLRSLHRVFQEQNIRGILLPPHGPSQRDWRDFPWEDYSVARFGRSLKYPAAHLVTANQLANTYLAVRSMRERGYRRIGLVAQAPGHDPRGPHFTSGFLSAREHFRDAGSMSIFHVLGPPGKEEVARFKKWLKKERPEALLSIDDHRSLFQAAGLRVPDDVALAVTSVLDGGADSGMDQHPEEIGRVALLLMNSLIRDGERGLPKVFRQVLVEGSWVDGASLPDRRHQSEGTVFRISASCSE